MYFFFLFFFTPHRTPQMAGYSISRVWPLPGRSRSIEISIFLGILLTEHLKIVVWSTVIKFSGLTFRSSKFFAFFLNTGKVGNIGCAITGEMLQPGDGKYNNTGQ